VCILFHFFLEVPHFQFKIENKKSWSAVTILVACESFTHFLHQTKKKKNMALQFLKHPVTISRGFHNETTLAFLSRLRIPKRPFSGTLSIEYLLKLLLLWLLGQNINLFPHLCSIWGYECSNFSSYTLLKDKKKKNYWNL